MRINKRLKQSGNLLMLAVGMMVIASCAVPNNIGYFQDAAEVSNMTSIPVNGIKVQKGDKLFIQVKVQGNEEINRMFSMMGGSGSYSANITSTQNSPYGYTVNDNGDIGFPVVGNIHVEGLTRPEVERLVKQRIEESGQARDVTVTAMFMNLHFSVLGEVTSAGQYTIDRDEITILEALSMARDLTINGKRENVLVFREVDGKQKVYTVDLTKAQDVINSPVYYLQQNDVVYVEPNNMKKRQSTVNGNNVYSTSFWISVTSLLTSVLVLFKNW